MSFTEFKIHSLCGITHAILLFLLSFARSVFNIISANRFKTLQGQRIKSS